MDEKALMELVEGKPAPMPLLAVQAFANTLDVEEGIDKLADPASLRGWLRRPAWLRPASSSARASWRRRGPCGTRCVRL